MATAPSTAAVRNGTAIDKANRHWTRQLLKANCDRAEPGRLGCGWVVPAMPAAGEGPVWGWPPEAAGPVTGCGPMPAASRPPTGPQPSPPALPLARGTKPPRSAGPPLTAPAAPAGSPGFVTDRLRTTFAPRIGMPEPGACLAEAAQAALHMHRLSLRRWPLLGSPGRPSTL